MGLLDEMQKKKEEKAQEYHQPNSEEAGEEYLQRITKLRQEIERLISGNEILNNENKSLLERIKQADVTEKIANELSNELTKQKALNVAVERKYRGQLETIDTLNRRLAQEQATTKELTGKLRDERNLSDRAEGVVKNESQKIKVMFAGNLILTVALLLILTVQKKAVFLECGKWFKDRGNNIYGFLLFLKNGLYMGVCKLVEKTFHLGEVGSNLITIVVMILLLVGLAFLMANILEKLSWKVYRIQTVFEDKDHPKFIFKNIVSVTIVIVAFVVCLTFYTPIKKVIPFLNIFSIWLLISVVGVLIWNGKELIEAIKG